MTSIGKSQTALAGVQESGKSNVLERRMQIWGWVFISPWIIGFLIFTLLPMIASFIFSLMRFQLTRPDEIEFIGLQNYARILTDPLVAQSALVTLRFAAIALPFAVIVPLAMASLLNSKHLWAKRVFRTLFYMPYMVPVVSAVYIWNGFLNAESGWLNNFLGSIGIEGPNWLGSIDWIYPGLVMIGIWGSGNAMLTTLAAMQGVPSELYEAAHVDGAGPFTTFRKITVPMISPVIFYNLVLAVIGLFRYFDIPYILKKGTGDPGNSTFFYNLYLYKNAFTYQDMGYGATLAWVMFVVALAVTILLFIMARRWVYYTGGDR